MIEPVFKVALTLGWDTKPAKLDNRMNLLSHTLNAIAIAERLIHVYEKFELFKFNETEKKLIYASLFIHDFSKADDDIIKLVESGRLEDLPKRLKSRKDVLNVLFEFGLNESEVEKAIDLAVSMERPNPSDLHEFFSCKAISGKLDRVLRLSDILASIKSVEDVRKNTIRSLIKPLELKFHKVSVIRGISTQLLHKAIQKVVESKGWVTTASTLDGVVYVGKGDFSFDRDELISALVEELEIFLDGFTPLERGSAAFGKFTATPIKAPEFIFVNRKTAEGFWKFIESQRVVSNPKDLSKDIRGGDRKNFEVLKTLKPNLEYLEYNTLYKLYNSMRYTLMIGIAVLREMKKLDSRLYETAVLYLREHGVNVDSLINANPRYNSPFKDVIAAVDEFVNGLKIENKRRKEIVSETIKLFREATILAVESINFEIPSLKQPLQRLAADLVYPQVEQIDYIDSYNDYVKGKIKGTPLCSLCGGKAEKLGVESLIGDGTESFANMLQGGSVIGGDNKIRICSICELEAKLRSLFMGKGSSEVIYIMPQCIIAPKFYEYFWTEAKKKLELASRIGGSETPSIYDLSRWAQVVLDGKFEDVASKSFTEVLQNTIEAATKDKRIAKAVKKKLDELYDGSLENLKGATGKDISRIEDVIKYAVEGDIDIINALDLEGIIGMKPSVGIALSNNYIVMLLDRLQRKNESETSYLIRKMFAALIISRIFSAIVITSDLPLSVIFTEVPKGAVKVPLKLGLKDFTSPYISRDGWIPFTKYKRIMEKIAAMILIDEKMKRINADYGANTLYELTKRSPGVILNKVVQTSNKQKVNLREFIDLLNILEEVKV